MKAILSALVAILLMFSLTACSDTDSTDNPMSAMYKQAAQSYIDAGDTASAIQALEEGIAATQDESLKTMLENLKAATTVETTTTTAASSEASVTTTTTATTTATTTTAPKVIHYADYNGEWATSGFGWESGGFHLTFDVKDTVISIDCSDVQANAFRIAEASAIANTSMAVGDTLTVGFQDSWGNRGVLTLTFKTDEILCCVSDVQESDTGSAWGLNEGNYTLKPFEESKTTLYMVIGPFGDPVYCTDPEDISTGCSDPTYYSPYEVIDVTDQYNYYDPTLW